MNGVFTFNLTLASIIEESKAFYQKTILKECDFAVITISDEVLAL